jgi:hypothetical protein
MLVLHDLGRSLDKKETIAFAKEKKQLVATVMDHIACDQPRRQKDVSTQYFMIKGQWLTEYELSMWTLSALKRLLPSLPHGQDRLGRYKTTASKHSNPKNTLCLRMWIMDMSHGCLMPGVVVHKDE